MTPQEYAMQNGVSVQEAKRLLGRRNTKAKFAASGAGAPKRTSPTLATSNPAPQPAAAATPPATKVA